MLTIRRAALKLGPPTPPLPGLCTVLAVYGCTCSTIHAEFCEIFQVMSFEFPLYLSPNTLYGSGAVGISTQY